MIKSVIKLNQALLKLFNSVIELEPATPPSIEDLKLEDTEDFVKVLLEDYAVVLQPEAQYAAQTVMTHCKATRVNHKACNSTFYAKWETVMKKSRLELFIDQILHYASTYGTNFTGEVYLPDVDRENPEGKLPVFVVGTLTPEEAVSKTVNLLSSGTALTETTIYSSIEVISQLQAPIDINEVRNKEAKLLLMEKMGIMDVPPEEFVRFLVYICMTKTLLIKSKAVIDQIRISRVNVSNYIEEYPHFDKLASVFNRFKVLFLAMRKSHPENVKIINRLARLSKTKHIPMVTNPLNCVTWRELQSTEMHWLENATNSALLRAINCTKLYSTPHEGHTYQIRNGKAWISTKSLKESQISIAQKNFDTLMKYYKSRVGNQLVGKKVYVPPGIEYGLPISEKQMVGNIPMGTKIHSMGENFAVGVYWKSEYNVRDIDLGSLSINGEKVGWNSSYNNNGITYSGDITSPGENGATEYLLYSNNGTFKDSAAIVTVNCFYGNTRNWSYDIVCGRGNKTNKDYLMDPSKVDFTARYNSQQSQNYIGVITRAGSNSTFYFKLLPTSGGRVSSANDLSKYSTLSLMHEIEHSMTLNELLFEHLDAEPVQDPNEADIDLSVNQISRDIFNLLGETK